MDGFVLALVVITTLAWGFQNYVGATVSRSLPAVSVAFFTQAFGFLFIAPLALIGPGSLTSQGVQWGMVAALVGVVGWVASYASTAIGQIAVVQKLQSGMAAVLPFVVALLTGFTPSFFSLVGLALLVASMIVLVRRPMTLPSRGIGQSSKAMGLAILAGAGFGMAIVALGHTDTGDGIFPFAVYRWVAAVILVVVVIAKRQQLLPPRSLLTPLLWTAFLSTIGDVAILLAVQHGSYALVPAATSLYPAVTALLARFHAKEMLHPLQITGIVGGLAGLVILKL